MRLWPTLRRTSWLEGLLRQPAATAFWRRTFDAAFFGDIRDYYWQLTFASWVHNALTTPSFEQGGQQQGMPMVLTAAPRVTARARDSDDAKAARILVDGFYAALGAEAASVTPALRRRDLV